MRTSFESRFHFEFFTPFCNDFITFSASKISRWRPSWWKVPCWSPLVTKINGGMEYSNNGRNGDWQNYPMLRSVLYSKITISIWLIRWKHIYSRWVPRLRLMLLIFCRGQIGFNFVGTPVWRTLAEVLVATNRVSASISALLEKTLVHLSFTRVSRQFLIGWGTREPDKLSWSTSHSPTRPEKTFWDLALSDIARQAPILPQTCLNSPHTSRQATIFCRPTQILLLCGGL